MKLGGIGDEIVVIAAFDPSAGATPLWLLHFQTPHLLHSAYLPSHLVNRAICPPKADQSGFEP
jgi:hypothetical protein